jgi:hypothetical protein
MDPLKFMARDTSVLPAMDPLKFMARDTANTKAGISACEPASEYLHVACVCVCVCVRALSVWLVSERQNRPSEHVNKNNSPGGGEVWIMEEGVRMHVAYSTEVLISYVKSGPQYFKTATSDALISCS